MNRFRRFFWVITLSVIPFYGLFPQVLSKAYIQYIEKYHQIAERQQREHGIPASIILAQGLLESGAGQSALTLMSNNHFGIKCSDWTGDRVFYDDDAHNDCFRKYNSVLDSYEDHALFLKNRSRYAFLFKLNSMDYEGWAFGLKKAGYATDPAYAYKLISIIEDYNLHRFDLGQNVNYAATSNGLSSQNANQTMASNSASMGTISAEINHSVYKVNRTRCVNALQGDTYASLADEFNISENQLRDMNEVASSDILQPGTRVYLGYKKRRAECGVKFHQVQPGESMYTIAQDYGIQTGSLYNLNHMPYTEAAQVGQVLKMR